MLSAVISAFLHLKFMFLLVFLLLKNSATYCNGLFKGFY